MIQTKVIPAVSVIIPVIRHDPISWLMAMPNLFKTLIIVLHAAGLFPST